jgi:hypothetical protein
VSLALLIPLRQLGSLANRCRLRRQGQRTTKASRLDCHRDQRRKAAVARVFDRGRDVEHEPEDYLGRTDLRRPPDPDLGGFTHPDTLTTWASPRERSGPRLHDAQVVAGPSAEPPA